MPRERRDPAQTERRSQTKIADLGKHAAASRADATRDKCDIAMKQIEAAIVANAGIYPEREGRISLQEVLRVAKLSPAALEKARHAATKQKIQSWLAEIHRRGATSAPKIRRLVTERADVANDRVKEIMQVWHEAELEYHEHRIELAKTIEENSRLRAELSRVRVEAAGDKVVAIAAKKGER